MTAPRRALFVVTILVGSFLLFIIQPMVARMALPGLGGAPNVWNSAMLVYQALLLAGYAYAHRISGLPFRRQAKLHLSLLLVFGLTLPVTLFRLPPPLAGWEVLWVPLLLLLTVGPVFFIISAQAPLMQRWFAAHPRAGEPWALYAASNLGSFAGLVAYPLVAEPLFALDSQSWVWSIGYAALIGLVVLCALARWHSPELPSRPARSASSDSLDPAVEPQPIGVRRILLWLALSAVPSGLMLSTTTHLTTDIFAMPLLWVIPLGIYLLSFVVAFADNRDIAWAVKLFAPATMLFAGGFTMVSRHSGDMTIAFASMVLLFAVAVSLHSKLYDLRPAASRLTLFYLVMSAGGALGGLFTAIIAPVAFEWVWEHPLLVLAAALLMPLPEVLQWRSRIDVDQDIARFGGAVLLCLCGFLAWLLAGEAGQAEPGTHRIFLTVLLSGIGLLLVPWRWMFVSVLGILMIAQGGLETIEASLAGQRTRSYFGVYTVLEHPAQKLRLLVHGTTLHGQQSTDPARLTEPMTYYGPDTGVAIALAAAPRLSGQQARVGVVGLGTGTLACYRRAGQDWTFFEIDPQVLEFSRDGTFTFLDNCAPDAKVVLGDARLAIEEMPGHSFDVLAIDAFSSDAIPLHLLTREAVAAYMRVLSEDGVLVLHISNRYIDLQPVVAAIARDLGLALRVRNDNPEDRLLLTPSSWVVMARDQETLDTLAEVRPDAAWDDPSQPAPRAWSDDHASILPHLRWSQLLGDL